MATAKLGPETERERIINELQELAAKLRKQKERVLPRRPIVIEFCGSPKSGKSSSINSLSMFLRRNRIKNLVLSERGAICPIRNKFDPYFNVWAGCSVLASFAEIMTNHPKDYDVVIMDRGFFDAICWFHWQRALFELDDPHYKRFVDFFLSPKWTRKVSILYIFKANPEISLKREYATLLTKEHGSIMNPDVLKSFNQAVDECATLHGVHFAKKMRRIDTSDKPQDEVNYEVTKEILTTLEGMVKEKIGYIGTSTLDSTDAEVFDPEAIFGRIAQLGFGERDWVESQAEIVQPIPVAVITDPEVKRIVVAKKLMSATSIGSPERKHNLIYFGGHIREEDSWDLSGPEGFPTVAADALTRELKEELDIDYVCSEKPKFCIWNRDNPKSAKHVALVYHVKLNLRSLRVIADRKEFAERGAYITDVEKLQQGNYNLERWSELIMERIVNRALTS